MSKKGIWISDLTHTTQGISAATFPLGASFVYSYAKKTFKEEFDFNKVKDFLLQNYHLDRIKNATK